MGHLTEIIIYAGLAVGYLAVLALTEGSARAYVTTKTAPGSHSRIHVACTTPLPAEVPEPAALPFGHVASFREPRGAVRAR